MSQEEIWRALDRAADGLDEVDFTATAWGQGRRARRRRQVATGTSLTVGGLAAFAVAFSVLGGGELSAQDPMVATSSPTVDEAVTTTPSPRTERTGASESAPTSGPRRSTGPRQDTEPSQAPTPPPSEQVRSEPDQPVRTTPGEDRTSQTESETVPGQQSPSADPDPVEAVLGLGAGTVAGMPMSASADQLVRAITGVFGPPEYFTPGVAPRDCAGTPPYGDSYTWEREGLSFTTQVVDGAQVGLTWQLNSASDLVELPAGLMVGMSEQELRDRVTVVEEMPSAQNRILVLEGGLYALVDPVGSAVIQIGWPYSQPC